MQKLYSLLATGLSIILLCFLLVSPQGVQAQCDPPGQLPEQMCENAPITCLQDACYSTQTWPPNGEPAMWCGPNTAVHNPQYFLFQATSATVQINIHVNSCQGGGCGLQSAIIDTCTGETPPWQIDNVLVCDPGQPVGGTMILTYDQMEIDSFYWLMIDGCANDICEYTIEFVAGLYTPDIPGELNDAYTNFPVVCQGQDEWTAVATPPFLEAHGYLWTGFPWGDGTHTSTYNDMSGPDDGLSIPDDAPPGIYEICVVAFSGCDTTDIEQCFDLEIIEIDDEMAEPETLCPEDFVGESWNGMSISGPGIYMQTFNTPEGCPYDSIKEYFAYPEPEEGQIDTVVCAEFYTYEGVEYNMGGSYLLQYPDGSINGCDSTAMLNLDLIYLEAETDFYCEFQLFTLTSQIILAIPNQSGVSYEWFLNGTMVSEDASFSTTEEGCYDLYVSYEINGVVCTYPATTNPLCIVYDDLVPPQPALDDYSNTACALDFPTYSVVEEPLLEYNWTIEPSGVPVFGNGSAEIEVNWQGFDGGLVCVAAINECGEGDTTCFEVVVIPSPIADFQMPPEVCVDSNATIQFTGVASPDATFIWNFGGGTVSSGGTGPGPHEVSWGSPGFHTVSLQVAETGCDTSDITYDIFVEALGQPVVSCNSTLNSVTFEWTQVPGASTYMVNVLGGAPMGMFLNDTTYEIGGLTPGTTVQIEVIAVGVGACAEQSVIADCIAQSCPPKMISIQLPADSFCLGDVTMPINLVALVDGVATPGTWSGPGVDPAGTFDPQIAGTGQHQIVYMLMEGTCSYQRSTTVQVLATPTADFTIDMAICELDNASVQYAGSASVNATYSWNFGGGTQVGGGTGAGPYTLQFANPGTYTVSLTVEENNCVSETITHDIEVQSEIGTPTIQCFATTSSATLQWSMVAGATAYNVTHLFGPMGAVVGNQYQATGLVPGDSVSIEIEVAGSGLCPPVIVQASCVAKDCPSPEIDVKPVDDICLYPGTGTIALEVEVMNGNGTGMWSGSGVTDPNQGVFDPSVAGPGSHMVDYNYSDDGCSFVESIVINVFDIPTATISNTDLILTCDNGNQLTLDGSSSIAPGTISYNWSTTGVIVGPTDQGTIVAGAPGNYTLTIEDLTSGCRDSVTVSVAQDDGVPTADAGPDGLLNCNIDFVVLGGTSSSGPSITYEWTTDDGNIMSDVTQSSVTVTEGGTYTLIVRDGSNGCESMDEAFVGVDTENPSGTLAVADILDCDTESTTVSATIMQAGGTYDYEWSTQDGQILSGNGTDEITVDRAGTYQLIVTSQINGCKDTVDVEVFADPTIISDLNTLVDNPNCPGDNDGMIEITQVVGGTPPYTYAWSSGSSGSGLLFLAPGTYSVTVTDANGCSVQQSYVLPAPQPINPDIGTNLTANIGETVTLVLTVNNPGSVGEIIWEGTSPACPNCFENVFTAEASGDVIVTVIDTSGCIEMTTIRLTVYRPRNVFVPNVFSPNGDNINDIFRIQGNTIELINYMRIFDRWGALVYEQGPTTQGDDQGWNGTRNSEQLNPGVYVYAAELLHDDGFVEVISGDITLIR